MDSIPTNNRKKGKDLDEDDDENKVEKDEGSPIVS
jgi:hypothetical protein